MVRFHTEEPSIVNMIKKCKICSKEKDISDFYSNGYHKSGKQKTKPSCKQCEQNYDKVRYQEIIKNHFGGLKCKFCGYSKLFSVLDLHHLDPSEKEYEVSKLRTYNEKTIIKELEKCILLCANCHREEHVRIRAEQKAAGIPCKDSV